MPSQLAKAENFSSLTALATKFSVPILRSEAEHFSGSASGKDLIAAQMRRMDEEMIKFSTNLLRLNDPSKLKAGMTSLMDTPVATWDVINKSPLVEAEGENRVLKLQFDVSSFSPEEVTVKILNNMLIVSAQKMENDNGIESEYHRDFLLPLNTKPESVKSSLSKDGVLTVRAPLIITPENEEQSTAVNT